MSLHNSRKWLAVLTLMLVLSMLAAACGGDDKKDDKKSDDLSQSFTGANGVTVKYPEGWIARDGNDGSVELGNSQATMDAMGSDSGEIPQDAVGVMVFAMPLAQMGMADQPIKDVMGMMVQAMGDAESEISDVKDTKLGGNDAARADIKDNSTKTEGFFVGTITKDGNLIMVAAVAHSGELDKYEATALKIAESASYAAPAAE